MSLKFKLTISPAGMNLQKQVLVLVKVQIQVLVQLQILVQVQILLKVLVPKVFVMFIFKIKVNKIRASIVGHCSKDIHEDLVEVIEAPGTIAGAITIIAEVIQIIVEAIQIIVDMEVTQIIVEVMPIIKVIIIIKEDIPEVIWVLQEVEFRTTESTLR